MSQKVERIPHLQSIRSLPVDFRLMDAQEDHSSRKSDTVIMNNGTVYDSIAENVKVAGKKSNDKVDSNGYESPYEKGPYRGEGLNSAASTSQSYGSLLNDSKWNDTSYDANKVSNTHILLLDFFAHLFLSKLNMVILVCLVNLCDKLIYIKDNIKVKGCPHFLRLCSSMYIC